MKGKKTPAGNISGAHRWMPTGCFSAVSESGCKDLSGGYLTPRVVAGRSPRTVATPSDARKQGVGVNEPVFTTTSSGKERAAQKWEPEGDGRRLKVLRSRPQPSLAELKRLDKKRWAKFYKVWKGAK